jgi:hypothetical protein
VPYVLRESGNFNRWITRPSYWHPTVEERFKEPVLRRDSNVPESTHETDARLHHCCALPLNFGRDICRSDWRVSPAGDEITCHSDEAVDRVAECKALASKRIPNRDEVGAEDDFPFLECAQDFERCIGRAP